MKSDDAIVFQDVYKSFRKTSRKSEYSTFKSELVAIIRGQRKLFEKPTFIEALKGVDLRVPRGSTVGIVGRNGSGKSTLLKLITGIYAPTRGTVTVKGRISALLELGAGFHPDFTGRENIFINGIILGMSRSELKTRVPEIIEFAELGDFIDEPVRTYSSGMFMRLAFSVATHVDPDLLIIDEILSVGDEHFARKSQARMSEFRRSGKTIILVTHDLNTVQSWCDSAAWIDGGRIREFGRAETIVNAYRRAIAAAEAEQQKTGHSALSAPGLALPAEAMPPEKPSVASLQSVRVYEPSQSPAGSAAFAPERPLCVDLDWTLAEKATTRFGIDLMSPDGRLVFSSEWDGGELSGQGTVRVELERLGLGGGVYELVASAKVGEEQGSQLRAPLHVSETEGVGLLRPQLRWSKVP